MGFLSQAFRFAPIFIFGITGASINEKSGHLNMGIPGMVCLGVLGAILGAILVSNGYPGVAINPFLAFLVPTLFGMVFAALGGLLFSFLAVTLKCNQNVVGLILTTLLTALANLFIKEVSTSDFAVRVKGVAQTVQHLFPQYGAAGWFGQLILGQSIFFFLAIIFAILASVILKKTRVGLNLRACGENPAAADAVGINVDLYRYVATIVSGAIVGIAGVSFVLDYSTGLYNIDNAYSSYGWLILAMVILSNWTPWIGIFVGLGLGIVSFIPYQAGIPSSLVTIFKIIPYVVTILILIVTSIFNAKRMSSPSALGQTYFREER